MTKKNFVALADAIREVNADSSATPFTDWQVGTLADFCAAQNDQFNRERWLGYIAGSNGEYQPKTGQACGCRPGMQRDNCPQCEGTGQCIDFGAIRGAR